MNERVDQNYEKLLQVFSELQKQTNSIQESIRPMTTMIESSGVTNLVSEMQKAMEPIKSTEITKNLTAGLEPLIRTMELTKIGFSSREIAELVDDGKLERVKHGFYRISEFSEADSEEKMIAQLYPDAVLTLTSALFYYGYIDRTPMAWEIAVDRDTSKARFNIDYPYVQPYYMEKKHLEYGITTAQYEACFLRIFDRDRLICECIKHENKIERETFNKAIIGYINDNKKNVTHLLDYAKKRNIHKKVRERLEVWL